MEAFFQTLGMTMGLFITSIAKSTNSVIQIGSAFVFPAFLLSGILWPRQGMPAVLNWISVALPSTLSAELVKELVVKSYATLALVCSGVGIPFVWIVCLFSLAVYCANNNIQLV